jgi:lipopolysaccharide biosynthesis glycosyltransferase
VASAHESALVFAADEGFAQPTAVAMYSALRHLAPVPEVGIYVLDNGIVPPSRERLQKVAHRAGGSKIRWLDVPPDRLVEHQGRQHLTSTAYARLLIPELLPPHIGRAVYLDGDILVTDDLLPLFKVPLDGAPFGAVKDFHVPTTDSERSSIRELAEPKPYCNTGVLVIDPVQWRGEGFTERALAFARSTPEPLPFADQDAMNAVANRWRELDFRWNVQVLSMYWPDLPGSELKEWLIRHRDELYRDAAVLHFGGVPKPWQPWSFATSRGKSAWVHALIRSGWHTPAQSLRWSSHWLVRRGLDAARRAMRAHSSARRGSETSAAHPD